jgi:hypothetical protein
MISIMALVLVISIGFPVPKAAAQSDKYSKMAPVDQYLVERNAEILLARSAAPDSISKTPIAVYSHDQAASRYGENQRSSRVLYFLDFCRSFFSPKTAE